MTDRMARRLAAVATVIAVTTVAVACSLPAGRDRGSGAAAGTAAPGTSDESAAGRRLLDLAEQWEWRHPRGESVGIPAADANGVAVVVNRHLLVTLDPSGALRWQVDRSGLRDVAPALTAELVVAPTEEGVVAYDRATGRARWETSLDDRVNTPLLGGSRAVVTTWEGQLAALDLSDGRVAWRAELGGNVLGPPAVAGATAVATFDTGRAAGAVAYDVGSGRRRWAAPLDSDGVSAPAITSAGVVVVVAGDVGAHGLAVDDGSERWYTPLGGSGSPEVPPLALADGTVVVAHRLAGMAHLDGRDGSIRWESSTDGAAVRGGPAGPGPNGWFALPLVDGALFLAADRGAQVDELPSAVAGVASGPGGVLLLATGKGPENKLAAASGW